MENKQKKDFKFVLDLTATRTAGEDSSKLSLKLESDCDMQFMVNVFVQLFKQDESIAAAARMAMLVDMVGVDGLEKAVEEFKSSKN